jgi:hypothetical protein
MPSMVRFAPGSGTKSSTPDAVTSVGQICKSLPLVHRSLCFQPIDTWRIGGSYLQFTGRNWGNQFSTPALGSGSTANSTTGMARPFTRWLPSGR